MSLQHTQKARPWLFALILVYISQLFSVGAHAAMISPGSSFTTVVAQPPPCHSDNEQVEFSDQSEEPLEHTQDDEHCCENGCSMTSCQPSSAIWGESASITRDASHHIVFSFHATFSSESVKALFQPPVLG